MRNKLILAAKFLISFLVVFPLLFIVNVALLFIFARILKELLFGSFDNPMIFIPLDIIFILLGVFIFTRPSVKFRMKELWQQIYKNL